MLENSVIATKGLVDHLGQPAKSKAIALPPLDDPKVWEAEPAYEPPRNVDTKAAQKWIDSIIGVTRDNQSILKLVWSGDRSYWYQFFMERGELVKRPRLRSKLIFDSNKGMRRDVFPPRWILLLRLEPEQYADKWREESWVFDPAVGRRLIRPEEPPKVFWMWYATVAKHSDYCCATAEKEKRFCFGKYAEPYFMQELLESQRRANDAAGTKNPFEKADPSLISEIEDSNCGYAQEMAELETEAQIAIENPFALLGLEASMLADVNTIAEARTMVKEFYDRQAQEKAAEIARRN